jgi:hypothetical protein
MEVRFLGVVEIGDSGPQGLNFLDLDHPLRNIGRLASPLLKRWAKQTRRAPTSLRAELSGAGLRANAGRAPALLDQYLAPAKHPGFSAAL